MREVDLRTDGLMRSRLREYTPTEAENAIDKRIIGRPSTSHRSRAITDDDLLRLKLWFGVGSILSAERRKRLFAAIDEILKPTRSESMTI